MLPTTSWLTALFPEIVLLMMSCVVLFAHLFGGRHEARLTYFFTQTSLVLAFICALQLWNVDGIFMNGQFVLDKLAVLLKAALFITASVVFVYAKSYLDSDQKHASIYYLLTLFSVLGACVLISAGSMLTLYLGIELVALPLYALIAVVPLKGTGTEAAIKYFVMGALASGMLLFGMSLVYGSTGSIDLSVETLVAPTLSGTNTLLLVGLVFIVVGIAFKFGAVPFHMWLPDVYQGSLNAVTLWIASVPEIAAFGMLIRLLVGYFIAYAIEWQNFIFVMALLSLILGNFCALVQKNIKRLLAYSTISHMGFLFLAVYAMAFPSALYYVLAYVLMTAAAFGVLVILSQTGCELEDIDDLKGLSKRNPWIAFLMMLIFFSLAGVPPTIGFYAKLSVLMALVDQGALFAAGLALLMSVIGAFYYLRVVKVMYFDEPLAGAHSFQIKGTATTLLSINAVATWVLGLTPGFLMGLCLIALA